jgi:hypothetical protein
MTRKGASHGGKRGFVGFADLFQGVLRGLVDPYRPELHYMRGPGPKWHAKHDQPSAEFGTVAGLARVRAKR